MLPIMLPTTAHPELRLLLSSARTHARHHRGLRSAQLLLLLLLLLLHAL
jgi:hypothetical protein